MNNTDISDIVKESLIYIILYTFNKELHQLNNLKNKNKKFEA